MPKIAYSCALAAGLLAALGVAHQRVGLALAVLLLLLLAVAASGGPPARGRAPLLAIGPALAIQPVLRDAGWVVCVAALAALAAAGALATAPRTWRALIRALAAPLRILGGAALFVRVTATLLPAGPARHWAAVMRGGVLAAVLLGAFGVLFVTADAAFAQLVEESIELQVDTGALLWRALLGATATAVAGAFVLAARRRPPGPERMGGAPGVLELRIALGALVVLFLVFVVVQLQVLFGGSAYVQRTTGLGLGEYARQGFTQMLLVAALTMAVVGFAGRRRDPVVRLLLAALCLLCLIVLASAQNRLGLVVDAYGLTRVRIAGEAIVPWLALLLILVLAAGASPGVARRAPRLALTGSLLAVLAFSVSNPDRRIAERAVERHADTGRIDVAYLARLSADALPALEEVPPPLLGRAVAPLDRRLERPDGLAGFNLARARARR